MTYLKRSPSASGRARGVSAAVVSAFFVSGACGLIHEIAWTRLLRLVMGNDTFSITTVLCAFMGGLALGSYVAGRLLSARSRPLRAFALLEGAIALYCLTLPFLIDALQPLYRHIYQNTHTSFYVFSLIRFFFSSLLLLVPATFMGATLPVLCGFLAAWSRRVGWSVGTLYAVNTFGAVAGVFASGFFLIPTLGVKATILVASALNGLVCLTAFVLHARTRRWESTAESDTRDQAPHPAAEANEPDQSVSYGRMVVLAALAGYGLSGAAALIYEVAWTRLLALMIGPSVYAFSIMLTAFIAGLALGSAILATRADRLRDPLRWLAGIEIAIGLSALAMIPIFGKLPAFFMDLFWSARSSFWLQCLAQFGVVFLIMLFPTTLMGAAFPITSRILARSPATTGRSVGAVYGSNTLGSIVGAFAAGFVLIPLLGIQNTIVAASALNVLVGCALIGLSVTVPGPRRTLVAGLSAIATIALITELPAWDASRMSVGPFELSQRVSRLEAPSGATIDEYAAKGRVVFHNEGLGTTLTVRHFRDEGLILYVNGKPEASTTGDMPTQILSAHIPVLLHPECREVLVIGLASGITVGSAAAHPLQSIDCAEITPAMEQACRLFDDYNRHVLDDPRLNLIIADGRNHVALSSRLYDVIISEPSNPWIAGVADLFTLEFFESCHRRLEPDGILCAWLAIYNMDEHAFRSVVRTFSSVFADVTIWNPVASDYLLIGSKKPLGIDHRLLARRMKHAPVAEDLQRVGVRDVPQLMSRLVMGSQGAVRFANGAPLHTDDNALLEFATPRTMATGPDSSILLSAIEAHRQIDLSLLTETGEDEPAADGTTLTQVRARSRRLIEAVVHLYHAELHLVKGESDLAIDELSRAAAKDPDNVELLRHVELIHEQARLDSASGHDEKAINLYRKLLRIRPKDAEAYDELAHVYLRRGHSDAAIELYLEASQVLPEDPAPLFRIAQIEADDGRLENAARRYRQVLALAPDSSEAHNNLGTIQSQLGELDDAIGHFQRAVELKPQSPIAHNNLGDAQLERNDFDAAMASFRRAIEQDPNMAVAHINLARVLLNHEDPIFRDPKQAVLLAETACRLTDRRHPGMLERLSAAYAAAGQHQDAVDTLKRAIPLADAAANEPMAKRLRDRLQELQGRKSDDATE